MQRLRASALLIRRCRPCRQLMLYQTRFRLALATPLAPQTRRPIPMPA